MAKGDNSDIVEIHKIYIFHFVLYYTVQNFFL